MWLAAESDDEYYAAEWESVGGEKLRVLHANLFPSFFTAQRAAREKRGPLLEAIVITLLSSLIAKRRDFTRSMLHLYVCALRNNTSEFLKNVFFFIIYTL